MLSIARKPGRSVIREAIANRGSRRSQTDLKGLVAYVSGNARMGNVLECLLIAFKR